MQANKLTGKRLPSYEQIYRELDATMIGAERQRYVDDFGEGRYDMYNEMALVDDHKLTKELRDMLKNEDECFIMIHSDNRERLNFAERVAQYYKADYVIKEEPWRHVKNDQFKIYIKTSAVE